MTSQLTDQEKISTSENNHYSSIRPWQWMALGSGSTILLFLSGFGAWTLASQLLLNGKVVVQNQGSLNAVDSSPQELGLDISNISRQQISGDPPLTSLKSMYTPMRNRETLVAVGNFQEAFVANAVKTPSSVPAKTPNEVQKPGTIRAVESDKPAGINPATQRNNDPKRESSTSSRDNSATTLASDSGAVDEATTKKSPSSGSFDNISFDWGWDFSEGLAAVQVGERWGYIDRMGRMAIKPRFQEASYFAEGLASIKSGDLWGYIDRTGKMVISPRFQESKEFSEGFAAVKFDGKWGYIDKDGSFVVQPQYDAAETFHEGLANIKSDDLWGYIDPTGRVKISLQFTDTWGFSQGIAQVKLGKRIAYIDKDGNFISSRP